MALDRTTEVVRALETLGAVLEHRGERHEVVLIGGSSLMLLGLIARATRDVDVLALVRNGSLVSGVPLPEGLRRAVEDVARDLGLDRDWLNSGPTRLLDFGLPTGFLERCETRKFGGLAARIASRFDQVHLKLYAATDQGERSKHFDDLSQLEASREELLAAGRWCRTQDPSPGFRVMLHQTLASLGQEVSDEDV